VNILIVDDQQSARTMMRHVVEGILREVPAPAGESA